MIFNQTVGGKATNYKEYIAANDGNAFPHENCVYIIISTASSLPYRYGSYASTKQPTEIVGGLNYYIFQMEGLSDEYVTVPSGTIILGPWANGNNPTMS